MNYLKSILKSSFEDFKRSKARTILTSLGILIGVLSVVMLISLGLGLKNYITQQFESLGTNIVIVFPGKILSGGGFNSGAGSLGGAKFDENDLIKLSRIPEAYYVAPFFVKTITVQYGGESDTSDLYASTDKLFPLRNLDVEVGRLFTSSDTQKGSKVAVIGPKIAEKLFSEKELALGKSVRIENQRYQVIGVLEKKGGGGFGGPDLDNFIYVPYKSAFSFNPSKDFLGFYIRTEKEDQVITLKEKVTEVLGKRYKEDDFSVVEQTEILNVVNSIFSVLNAVLVAIGSISLLVGGIGIMNIMYASVTERVKEIGIRRAIGATKKDILVQFMMEAVILSLFGGIAGLGLASLIVFAIHSFFPASLSPLAVFIALVVSSMIGIFFGVFPAKKASDLSPIEAIRYE